MSWQEVKAWLFPEAEKDEGFRSELQRQAVSGLRVIGLVNISVAMFITLARFVVAPDPGTLTLRITECLAMVTIGCVMLLVARASWAEHHGRLIGMASGIISSVVLVWFSLCMCEMSANADDFIPSQITIVLLVGITALPLKPMQTLLFGALMLADYVAAAKLAEYWTLPLAYLQPTYVLFVVTMTLLATALTANLYRQRAMSYGRYQETLRAQQDLREVQRRMLLSENAASLGRLAAALSHELNSPVGALASGVDTMLLLSARQSQNPMPAQRFVSLLNDLRKSIQEATERLKQIVARMQRISNLDRSEIQKVRIDELMSDVVGMAEARIREKAALDVDLKPVPPIICRPQQISAVFRNLLYNAVDAVNGEGRISVSTSATDSQVLVRIHDNGRGMSAEQIDAVFDPGFRVADGRVSTGNWNMFSSRQVVREHGGDIEVESKPGQGTTVNVSFRLNGQVLT